MIPNNIGLLIILISSGDENITNDYDEKKIEKRDKKGKWRLKNGDEYASNNQWKAAAKQYYAAIECGNIEAQCRLGWIYYYGRAPLKKDILTAKEHFYKAAMNRSGEGWYGLYKSGGLRELRMRPEEYLLKAIRLGYNPALQEINNKYPSLVNSAKYQMNADIKKNDDIVVLYEKSKYRDYKAFDELKHKAEDENPEACYFLGMFFQNAGSTEEHKDLCLKWYEKSRELGYKDAEKKIRLIAGYSYNKQDTCPRCGKPLTIKPGSNGGYFKGCTGYPHCQYTTPVSTPYYGRRMILDEDSCFREYCRKKLY